MADIDDNPDEIKPGDTFLQRVEHQRLGRECFRTLDMRRMADEVCKRYVYRGRTLWLDSASRMLFVTGLKQHAGLFTVGTCETILANGGQADPHALDAPVDVSGPDSVIVAKDTGLQEPDTAEGNTLGARAIQGATIELGYFEKRHHRRIKHTLPVLLLLGETIIPAETRDISCSGLQIRTKTPVQINKGDDVQIKISPVVAGRRATFPAVDYRVVRVKTLLSQTNLALACKEHDPNEALNFLQQIMDNRHGSGATTLELDTEDALLTSQALLAERFYMRSTSLIPFFLFKAPAKAGPLKTFLGNKNNEATLKAFEVAPGKYDFSQLVTRKRIKLLLELAHHENRGEYLVAVFRSDTNATPCVVSNTDFKYARDWYTFISSHIDEPLFRVFKLLARPAYRPDASRIHSDLDSLASQSNELAESFLTNAQHLICAGSLVDITAQVQSWDLSEYQSGKTAAPLESPANEPDNQLLPSPELFPIRYFEELRSEHRFLGQIRVEIAVSGRTFSGRTKDISVHGLAVISDDNAIPVTTGSRLHISFPVLEARSHVISRIRASYRDVPFQLVAIERRGETLLRLKLSTDKRGNQFATTFSRYIERRKSKLPLELSHIFRPAAFRFYSSVYIESTSSIPIFLSQHSTKRQCVIKVGIVDAPSPLIHFFEVADGEFDFSAIQECKRLNRVLQEVQQQGRGEIVLYLYKEKIPGKPRFKIHVATEDELCTPEKQTEFLQRAINHDFRFLKLVANKPQVPPSLEIEQAADHLQKLSKTKSVHLKSDFMDLIAIGDIVDITGQITEIQSGI